MTKAVRTYPESLLNKDVSHNDGTQQRPSTQAQIQTPGAQHPLQEAAISSIYDELCGTDSRGSEGNW